MYILVWSEKSKLRTKIDDVNSKAPTERASLSYGIYPPAPALRKGEGGITMPGKGKLIERDYTREEREAIEKAGVGAGLVPARFSSPAPAGSESRPDSSLQCLGEKTYDVYLNDVAYWRTFPRAFGSTPLEDIR